MDRDRLVLLAASNRLILGIAAVVALPMMYPGLTHFWWVFSMYLGVAVVLQLLLWKNWGGTFRAIGGCLLDLAMITFLVYRIGSAHTILVTLYFLPVLLGSMALGRTLGLSLSLVASAAYAIVSVLETSDILVYGPDAAGTLSTPTPGQTLFSTLLFDGMLIVVTLLVGMMQAQRERHLREANARLTHLCKRDPLTNLYNRRHLFEKLETGLSNVKSHKDRMAVLMVDLDGFKLVNDQHGHAEGDRTLRRAARALRGCARKTDVVGRFGGDEFVLVLPEADYRRASRVGWRIVEAIDRLGRSDDDGLQLGITASVGVALCGPEDSVESIFARVDGYVYRAKKAGGNQVCYEHTVSAELAPSFMTLSIEGTAETMEMTAFGKR